MKTKPIISENEAPVEFPDEEPPVETKTVQTQQTSLTGALFSDEEMILDEILSLDTDNMTPIAALQALARWKKTLSGR